MEDNVIEEVMDQISLRLGGHDFVLAYKQITIPLSQEYSFYKFGFMDCRSVRAGENRERVMKEANEFLDRLCEKEIKGKGLG